MPLGTIHIWGPCSAESRTQVMETAEAISSMLVVCPEVRFIFRAGAWKPRTSPDTFQGAGSVALEWLAEVKQQYGFDVATEVATPEHAAAAIKAGIDYLWIGARTGANPIAVSAIAEEIANCGAARPSDNKSTDEASLQSTLKGILIKNPVNADAALWMGNIARLEKTGLPVMAVHRGCNHQPYWAMAHRLRSERPDIPLLIDPSHMGGDAAKIESLLTKAAELSYDGTMIEVHPHPQEALSDVAQQITPTRLRDTLDSILSRLCLASLISPAKEPEEASELIWLRAEIDELDNRFWDTLAQRMDVSRRIGAWKKAHDVAPLQPERYEQIVRHRRQWAEENGLAPELVKQIFDLVHGESLKRQQ